MQLAKYLRMNNERNNSLAAGGFGVGREIIEYLLTHPAAADTVEGILDWWVPMQRRENAKNEIQQALQDLVRQGLIEEIVLGNGNRLYRLHKKQ